MIDKQAEHFLQLMERNELDDPEGNKEAQVIQVLRTTSDEELIIRICNAISEGGSWYTLPVLYARFKDYAEKPIAMLISNTIVALRKKRQWPQEFKQQFFDPAFWKIKWKASHGKFLSFISIIAGDPENGESIERLGESIIREIAYDCSPYANFSEMKLLEKNWDFQTDIMEILSASKSERAVNEMLKELNLPKDLEHLTAKTFDSLKNDYLITRLGLASEFSFQLTLFDTAIMLNQKSS